MAELPHFLSDAGIYPPFVIGFRMPMGTIVHAVLITMPGNVLREDASVEVLRFAADPCARRGSREKGEFPATGTENSQMTMW